MTFALQVGNIQEEIWKDVHCLLQLNLRSHRDLLITVTVIHLTNKHKQEKVGQTLYTPNSAIMGKLTS